MGSDDRLAELRRAVEDGHAAVRRGRYDEAEARFVEALPGLRAALGEGHPEVSTLTEDVATVRSMRSMASFARSMDEGWGQAPVASRWGPRGREDER